MGPMYGTIVVGTDGSPTAEQAVSQAATLAALTGAHLHLVTAVSSMPAVVAPEMMAVVGTQWTEAGNRLADEALERSTAIATAAGVTSTTHVLSGEPADCLLQVAEDVKADLLVVGNKGMQGPKRFLLGSVPNRCAHHAGCSVLIVHTS
jgi:nucleotide-binding universal stress UspA family protein